MTEKKTGTRRRRTTRKKKVPAPGSAASPDATPPTNVATAEASSASHESGTAETEKSPPATKLVSTPRRSRRKKKKAPAAEAAVPLADESVPEPPAKATVPEPAGTTKKKKRKRRTRKTRAAETTPPTGPAATPQVKPISPTAEIEQSEDAIVIRFPSAASSGEQAPASPTADNASAVPAAELPAAGSRLADSSSAPLRHKRRRRRKKKDPRVASAEAAPDDRRAEKEEDRRRPEPAEEAGGPAAPAPTERSTQHRRRRSRRGKRREEPAGEAPEQAEETADAPTLLGHKEMIINVSPLEECRIAIMEAGKLQEIYLERASAENQVGNIHKGIVTNVEPSIQAAFIDFGQGKNGFLHISDLHPQYFPNGAGNTEDVGRKMPRRNRPPIQRCLRRGQHLLVQITKEGIGTKGPTLTTYLSIPGRFLVMMPGMRQLGVSRKIEDDDARRKLRDQLVDLNLSQDAGFIARTAALGRTKRELQSDLNYLSRLWKAVETRIETLKAPAEIYTESDLVIRTIRDVYTSDIARIVVDDADVTKRAHEFLSIFSPRSRDTVVYYDDPEPIFHRYGIEEELDRLHSRHVPLKSGGSLVIDQTEALVAIDVNSGRFRTEDDAEATAYKIDLEAADEIPRQLRLRDLGGVVICDFIDVRQEKHKREIERRLNRNLKQHKERAKILRMSEFGIIELTRQRQRASLTRNVYQDCRHCRGTGLVKTAESVVLDVMRLIQLAATKENIRAIDVVVSMEVADLLQNRKRKALHELEARHGRSISIRSQPEFGLDQIQLRYCDQRGRIIPHN